MSNLETVLDQLIERDEIALANVLHVELETNAGLAGDAAAATAITLANLAIIIGSAWAGHKLASKLIKKLETRKKAMEGKGKDTSSIDRKLAGERKKREKLKLKAEKATAKRKDLRKKAKK